MLAWMTFNPLSVKALDLCIENRAKLDPQTFQAFHTELDRILSASELAAGLDICRPGAVAIMVQAEGVPEEPSALGGIRQLNGRLLPEIAIFVTPTALLIDNRLPAVLGRALARVAAHELGHLLSQRSKHNPSGLMSERFSAAHLLAPDRGFFRIPTSELLSFG
jgi:hypothetical protein